jgi:hypothetical protein
LPVKTFTTKYLLRHEKVERKERKAQESKEKAGRSANAEESVGERETERERRGACEKWMCD